MMGWGFYPSVTDLSTDIVPRHKAVLDMLEGECREATARAG